MHWKAVPSGRRGRQLAYSDAAIQACLTIKVLFGLPLRQATGFVASLLERMRRLCPIDFRLALRGLCRAEAC